MIEESKTKFQFNYFVKSIPRWHEAVLLAKEILSIMGTEPTETVRYGSDFKNKKLKLKTALKRDPNFDMRSEEYCFLEVYSVWPYLNGEIKHSKLHSSVAFSNFEDRKKRVYSISVSVDPGLVTQSDITSVYKKVSELLARYFKDDIVGFGTHIKYRTILSMYYGGVGLDFSDDQALEDEESLSSFKLELDKYWRSEYNINQLIEMDMFRSVYQMNFLNPKQTKKLQEIFVSYNNSHIIGELELFETGHGYWVVDSENREKAFKLLKEHAVVQYDQYHDLERFF